MASGKRTIVFPIETIAREFDGKLLLALVARERGWDIVIGNMAANRHMLSHMPTSVFFAKSARSTNAHRFAQLKALGHDVVMLDEEALVRQSDSIYLMKHDKDPLKNVDLVLTWGPDNTAMWENSGLLDGIHADPVGNPRIDMLRPRLRPFHEPAIAAIRERFGDYVLFNSNFATVNNVVSGATRFNLADWVPGEDAAREATGLLAHKRTLFERFQALLPRVAEAIAPRHLVIRPHPAEDHAAWHALASDLANASVVFEGSVVPWIAGARALIHNGCTSAVEAAVEGTPVLTYRPVTSEIYDNPLPNAVGTECFGDEALLEALARLLDSGPAPLTATQQALLEHHVALGGAGLCCDAIMDAIERRGIGRPREHRTPLGVWLKILVANQRRLLKRRGWRFSSRNKARAAYRAHKFPGLTAELADQRIARFQAVLSRFGGLRARELRRDVLEIVG
ncbi:MAG: surface carbohydrate biosynthesis protein [Paracoccaceae bacterium]